MIENYDKLEKLTGAPLAEYLLSAEGIYAEEFDTMAGSTIDRMNMVGSLRSMGFEVVGGRGKVYKVLSWTKPVEKVFNWTPERLEVQKWIESLRLFSVSHRPMVEKALATRPITRWHECSFGYLWAYEAVGNKAPGRACAYLIEDEDGGLAILQRRFKNFPRLRLIDINLDIEQYQILVPFISQLSTKPITIRNLVPDKLNRIRTCFPAFSQEKSHQSIYLVDAILRAPRDFLSKQSAKAMRKCLREVNFFLADMNDLNIQRDAKFIIDTWKKHKGADQLRLAIGRDYVCLSENTPGVKHIMGYRCDSKEPVSLRTVSFIPGPPGPQGVADLVEKSFNYSSLPGGHSGMSDASLIATCNILQSQGYTYINGGEGASVGKNLVAYKNKFESEAVYSTAITIEEVVI